MTQRGALDERVAGLSEELAMAFRALIEPIVGSSPRATDVQERLGLDKTQSWRVVKLMGGEDPFEAVYESPAPKGLLGIIRSADAAGASAEAISTAEDAVELFETLLAEFPDGRAGLDAALAAHVPKARDAIYRDARRKMAQGMAQIFGVRAAARYSAAIIVPSADDDVSCDVLLLTGYVGFRRLRTGPKPIVFAGRHYKAVPGAEPPRLPTRDPLAEEHRHRLVHARLARGEQQPKLLARHLKVQLRRGQRAEFVHVPQPRVVVAASVEREQPRRLRAGYSLVMPTREH
ncbi:MAG: hypothetical protein AAFN41_14540, partial [Planctomycetota bacterium]